MKDANDHPRDAGAIDAGVEWLRGEGRDADVVLSSRVRVARNFAALPFVNRCSREQRQQVLDTARAAISATLAPALLPHTRLTWIDMHQAGQLERALLVERHLVSKQFSRGKAETDEPRAVAISAPAERLAIMVNEEDHLRLQTLRSGLALDDAWRDADLVDDQIGQAVEYAYSPRFGHLTACPTNVGTGLRMSVMLHLPALKLTGDIERVRRAAADMNLAVRGFYGEGSEAVGDLFQLSNQTTLGKSEELILQDLAEQIIPQVIEYERRARNALVTKQRLALEDRVQRALGLLRHARLIAAEEAMALLSHVRLGIVAGVLPGVEQRAVNQLMLLVQPAHLQRVCGREMDQDQRREARAELLRRRLG